MKDTIEVQSKNTWNQFFITGRVEDYLRYVACKEEADIQNKQAVQAGDSPHAGVYTGNGNYIETDAYR